MMVQRGKTLDHIPWSFFISSSSFIFISYL